MLEDKQAEAGLHKRDQHSGYNPVERSRWGARLWGLNRAEQAGGDTSKSSTRESMSGVTRLGGVAGAGMHSRQGRSPRQACGSDIARPSLEAARFETGERHWGTARPAFRLHRAYSSRPQGWLVKEAAWPPRA